MTTTITAVFDSKPEAERAQASLAEHGIGRGKVNLMQGTNPGLPGSDPDSAAYNEALRRGGTVLLAQVDGAQVETAAESLEKNGAVDLDRREQDWHASGWTGASAAASAAPNDEIRVLEERLVIGKRDVSRGTVRVRVHVREVPVEVPVTLREEHAVVERHPVNRPATPADADVFQPKVLEAVEMAEQPVVSKEVVERVETVRDTVRRTEVEVDETPSTARPAPPTRT